MLIEDVYTRLEVASTVGEAESERANPPQLSDDMRQRQQSALGALSQRRRLVLLGPPGSGKSTLARFLTLCLARATLGNPAWLDRLGNEWTCGALLPIRIELTGFADWLTQHAMA